MIDAQRFPCPMLVVRMILNPNHVKSHSVGFRTSSNALYPTELSVRSFYTQYWITLSAISLKRSLRRLICSS
jgi:hypothetical protein